LRTIPHRSDIDELSMKKAKCKSKIAKAIGKDFGTQEPEFA
jgi:hypothetical protein